MIFYFSGTGNSLWVAQRLSVALGCKMTAIGDCTAAIHSNDDRVIWVFPIYSWGLPLVVKKFMSNHNLSFCGKPSHYMVCTCGDDIGFAHKQWRKVVEKRGWVARSSFSVQMPNTYTLMKGFDVDSPQTAQQKLAEAPSRVDFIAQQIKIGDETMAINDVVTGRWAWIKSRIIYPYFMKYCMSPKPFHATENCISCGRCSMECPLQNIAMTDGHPQWGDNCTMCLRCYHICPCKAVAYGKATKGKGQYLHP